jgi:hypothetical protein
LQLHRMEMCSDFESNKGEFISLIVYYPNLFRHKRLKSQDLLLFTI